MRRRGISEIVGTILLATIVLIIGGMLYLAYLMYLSTASKVIEQMTQETEAGLSEIVRVASPVVGCSNGTMYFYLYNAGPTVKIYAVRVAFLNDTVIAAKVFDQPLILGTGEVTLILMNASYVPTAAPALEVIIITENMRHVEIVEYVYGDVCYVG